ncbi:unnamed protein product [Brassica napus]|uniref:(rape) hypothetical protein n=1 Tax=Brassica napus TaxID=3708 RepID=A0A816LCW5_BRANA|nr:unnamed protein product [Brassica napus]
MSSKLLLDQSSEIVSQQRIVQICIGKMHLQPQGSDRLHLPHMETRATYIELAQQKGKCSCKYISGGIFKVKARRMCSARGAKLLPVSVLISKLLLLLCCRDLMLQKLLDFGEMRLVKRPSTGNYFSQAPFPPFMSKGLCQSKINLDVQASEVFLKDEKFFYKNSGDMLQTSSMKDSDPQKFWCSAH